MLAKLPATWSDMSELLKMGACFQNPSRYIARL